MSPTPGDGVKVWLAFFWRESVIAKKGFEGEIAKKAWSRKNGHDGAIAKKFGHDGVITKKLGMMMAWLQKNWAWYGKNSKREWREGEITQKIWHEGMITQKLLRLGRVSPSGG